MRYNPTPKLSRFHKSNERISEMRYVPFETLITAVQRAHSDKSPT